MNCAGWERKSIRGKGSVSYTHLLGYGQSVTTGVISATDRESTTTDTMTGETTTSDVRLIQTDAAINPGNSLSLIHI